MGFGWNKAFQVIGRLLTSTGIVIQAINMNSPLQIQTWIKRPYIYGTDWLNLGTQSDLLSTEKGHFLNRSRILTDLITKYEHLFEDNRIGSIQADSSNNGGPNIAEVTAALKVTPESSNDGPVEEQGELPPSREEVVDATPQMSEELLQQIGAMMQEDMKSISEASRAMLLNQPTDFNAEDFKDRLAKKVMAANENFLAKLKEEGEEVPSLKDIIEAEQEKKKVFATQQLKNQNPQSLAKLKNLAMFSGKSSKGNIDNIKQQNEQKIADIPSVKIPDFNPKKFNMNAFKLKRPKET